MDIEKKRFRKMFPNLAREIENGKCGTTISSVRSDPFTGEQAVAKRFTGYTPDVIDFLRRCDKSEQGEEIIRYLKEKGEISPEYARKLRKQLKEKGVRSFGPKKEDDYYLKMDFNPEKRKKRKS
jgi:hypothetical protein